MREVLPRKQPCQIIIQSRVGPEVTARLDDQSLDRGEARRNRNPVSLTNCEYGVINWSSLVPDKDSCGTPSSLLWAVSEIADRFLEKWDEHSTFTIFW